MVNIANECNLKSIALWSMNNKEYPMNEEQKAVRESILTTGIIPDGIDVLIINGSYETGINIKDENIELVIVNSTDADTQIQARSRVRKDIKALLLKSNNMIDDIKVVVPEKYLDTPLTTKDKKDLCKDLNMYNENTRILKWTSIKPIIINSGYDVNNHTIVRDKKRLRVDTIKEVIL